MMTASPTLPPKPEQKQHLEGLKFQLQNSETHHWSFKLLVCLLISPKTLVCNNFALERTSETPILHVFMKCGNCITIAARIVPAKVPVMEHEREKLAIPSCAKAS
jgi:hypothetical protein